MQHCRHAMCTKSVMHTEDSDFGENQSFEFQRALQAGNYQSCSAGAMSEPKITF